MIGRIKSRVRSGYVDLTVIGLRSKTFIKDQIMYGVYKLSKDNTNNLK